MPRAQVLRRNGQVQACEPCRLAKHRCDHTVPVCNRCQVRGKSESCVYHPAPMTKSRNPGEHSAERLHRILPEVRSPQETDSTSPVLSLTPSAYGSPATSLFKTPHRPHGSTSFSAVFNENQAQIGPELLQVDDDGLAREQNFEDDVRMSLATQTLAEFPTYLTCEHLLQRFSSLHDLFVSPKMIQHCTKSVWLAFGDVLNDVRRDEGLRKMARELFKNGRSAPCPDKEEPWVNWFCGSALRWEMIGVLFTFFGLSMMHRHDWDSIFNLPEQRGRSRRSASRRMMECANACLNLRNTEHSTTDLLVVLLKNISKLYSQIAGDECMYYPQKILS